MSFENVKLWFAKDNEDKIVTADEITEENKNNTYLCPVCGSQLKPKAIKSKQITSHFAHIDSTKCNNETMIHFWFKHKFIEPGDKFNIISDKEIEYICKSIEVEQPHETESGIYKPDVTIKTECGNTIYFEMAFSNKKKVQDYLDIWLELKNIVVEVDIKQLMFKEQKIRFKSLFYNGKCFNMKKNDPYYSTIGKYKEDKLKGNIDEKIRIRIGKLDWLWKDILKYKKGEVNIDHLSFLIDSIDKDDREVVELIFKKPSCLNILSDYMENKLNKKYYEIEKYVEEKYGMECTKYLRKDFQYIREPFMGSWYESKIKVADLKNESGYIYDFAYEDKTKEIKQKIDIIIPNNQEIEDYNLNVENLQNKIFKNDIHKGIMNYLSIKKDYDSIVKVNRYRKNLIDKFMLSFELRYKGRKISECSFGKKVEIHENIDDHLNLFEEKIQHYFKELQPIENVAELESKLNNFQIKYADFNLKIENELIFEDIYKITVKENDGYVLQTYYFFHNCVSDDINKNKIISHISNYQQLINIITNETEMFLKEETREHCYDCGTQFHLELGEIKFFLNKGFDFPKRCKPCRIKRKQIKQ